jgi:hypothetical protein
MLSIKFFRFDFYDAMIKRGATALNLLRAEHKRAGRGRFE